MTTVSIVYHSGSGHTARLAEAVARGAASIPDVKVQTIAISGKDIVEGRYKNASVFEQLDASDAIIFGSPTYMGGPSGQFKTFPTPPPGIGSARNGRTRSRPASAFPAARVATSSACCNTSIRSPCNTA